MKKLFTLLLILTSLLGYLEWGKGNHAFLGQVEYELLFQRTPQQDAFMHPFVLVPLVGQLLLLISLFQKTPRRWMIYTGIICLSLIMVFLFAIGIMSGNLCIALSAVPFIITAVITIIQIRRK